jgi:uncharacterized protein (TIGR02679 family)
VTAISVYRGEEYRRLLAAARRSLEQSGGDLSRSIGVAEPSDAERRAIIGITGVHRKNGAKRLEVRLDALDARLRDALGTGLIEALPVITGAPLRNLPEDRAQAAAARAHATGILTNSPLHDAHPWYAAWAARLTRDGTVTRLADQPGTSQLTHAVRALEYLEDRPPDAPPIPLPVLADTITRDTKALNKGTLATLVLRALAEKAAVPPPSRAEETRDLWDRFGVVVDDLASRVLVLNLPARGVGLGAWLTDAARLGTPFQVTLHQLTTLPIEVDATVMYICENPAVLRRAAEHLGPACPPLVCTEGRPSTAFHRLARTALIGGASLRYHGDFDWPGIEMTGQILRRYEARPWRMSADDYRQAVSQEIEHIPLKGTPRATAWDADLAVAMTETGVAVYEETCLDALLADLGRGAVT